MGWRKTLSTVNGGSGQGMGSCTGAGHDHFGKSSLQREIALGQNDSRRWEKLGRRTERHVAACACEQPHDLLRVPHFVDAELLWLPLIDDGKPEKADAAQRRAYYAKLYGV